MNNAIFNINNAKVCDKTKLKYVKYTDNDKYCLRVWRPKARKNSFAWYSFKTLEKRDAYLNACIDKELSHIKFKEKQEQNAIKEKNELLNKIIPGNYFYFSYGYNCTKYGFYQIISFDKKKETLVLREISSQVTDDKCNSYGGWYERPVKNYFIGKEQTVKINKTGLYIKFYSQKKPVSYSDDYLKKYWMNDN